MQADPSPCLSCFPLAGEEGAAVGQEAVAMHGGLILAWRAWCHPSCPSLRRSLYFWLTFSVVHPSVHSFSALNLTQKQSSPTAPSSLQPSPWNPPSSPLRQTSGAALTVTSRRCFQRHPHSPEVSLCSSVILRT